MKHNPFVARHFLMNGDSVGLGCKDTKWRKLMRFCHELNPNLPVNVVRDWLWVNVKFDEVCQKFSPSYLIWSNNVLWSYDELPNVRSKLFVRCHKKCIFEAEDGFYILVGDGRLQDMRLIF